MLYRDPRGSKNVKMTEMHHAGVIFNLKMIHHSLVAGEHVVDFQPPRESSHLQHAVLMAKVLVFLEKTRCAALEKKACRATIFGCKPVEVEICECASPMHSIINGIAQIIDVYFCL